jgi:hypothetical protein
LFFSLTTIPTLLQRIKGEDVPEETVVQPELVARESTAPSPSDSGESFSAAAAQSQSRYSS